MSQVITDEIIENTSKSETLQKEYKKKWYVPWRNVQDAIDQGYIYPGWKLIDYLRATDKGNPNLPKNPFDPNKIRKPFEYVNVWGVQGASKSNFCLQLLHSLYGNWDTAIQRMLLEREMLISAYEEVPNADQRIPAGCLDDLNTIISKQEWFVDKDFYILFHRFLNTIRTKFGAVLSTLPNVEFTPDMLGDLITFEVMIYPNSTYKVERYCWDIHPWEPVKAKFTKIVVETGKLDIYKVPPDKWNRYQERRFEVANKLFLQMKDYMETGGDKKEMKKKVVRSLEKEDLPINEIGAMAREAGLKAGQDTLVKFAKMMKEARSERAKKFLQAQEE